MKKRFPKNKYKQQAQIESVFSLHTRRLGSTLTTRSKDDQQREIQRRVLAHKLMILKHHDQKVSTEPEGLIHHLVALARDLFKGIRGSKK